MVKSPETPYVGELRKEAEALLAQAVPNGVQDVDRAEHADSIWRTFAGADRSTEKACEFLNVLFAPMGIDSASLLADNGARVVPGAGGATALEPEAVKFIADRLCLLMALAAATAEDFRSLRSRNQFFG